MFPASAPEPESMIARLSQEQDIIRRRIIQDIQKITGRKLISYIARFDHPGGNILPDDVPLFSDMMSSLNFPSELDLMINSPGGIVEVTEKIVSMIRDYVKSLIVIIPESAKSAATLIALASDEILMGYTSEIGPIDPQIVVGVDPTIRQPVFRPAWSYINSLRRLEEELRERVSDPNILIPLIHRIDPTLLDVAHNAISYAKTLAAQWLVRYMKLKPEDAERIANDLSDVSRNLSHSRPIRAQEAKRMGLNVNVLKGDSDLWKLLYELYLRSREALQGNRVKVIENEKTSIFQEAIMMRA